MSFQKFIGIDYSGGGTPLTRTPGLQVYLATADRLPKRVNPPSTPADRNRNWCRKEVAEWLIEQANSDKLFIAGLDFSFSLPLSCFQRYGLTGVGLLVWGARNPLVWRVLSVNGMGTGAGFLVWGILMAAMQEVPNFGSPAGIPVSSRLSRIQVTTGK